MPSVPSSPRVKLRASTRRVPRARSAGKTADGAADYEPEPNMKLSRALAVVLLLHVVAIGGIIAFSLIKDHNPAHLTADSASDSQNPAEVEDAHLTASSGRNTNDASMRAAVHVVQQGETLTRIANANGVSLQALVAANAGSTASGIRPGQQLKLPEKVSPPAVKPTTPANEAVSLIEQKPDLDADADQAAANLTPPNRQATPAPHSTLPDSGQTYTVGKGESPYTIAQKLKISANALLKLNGIDDPKKIKPGQKLRLPPKLESKPEAKSKPDMKPAPAAKPKAKADAKGKVKV